MVSAGRGSRAEPVPTDMAAAFGTLTGLDLGGILVHRGPEVSEQARAYRARAFTRSGEIFLPDEAGPIEHGESRALVAHELAHVVQQRVLARALPDEDSPDGQELESEAVSAERWHRHGGDPPPRLAHLPVAALLARTAGPGVPGHGVPVTGDGTIWSASTGWSSSAGWSSSSGASGQAAAGGVQRAGGDDRAVASAVPAQTVPAQTVTAWQGTGGTIPASLIDGASGGGHAAVPAVASGDGGTNGPASTAPAQTDGQPAETPANREEPAERERKSKKDVKRPADLDDPASLDELAAKVYPRLRRLLRGELITDRERAGLLADLS